MTADVVNFFLCDRIFSLDFVTEMWYNSCTLGNCAVTTHRRRRTGRGPADYAGANPPYTLWSHPRIVGRVEAHLRRNPPDKRLRGAGARLGQIGTHWDSCWDSRNCAADKDLPRSVPLSRCPAPPSITETAMDDRRNGDGGGRHFGRTAEQSQYGERQCFNYVGGKQGKTAKRGKTRGGVSRMRCSASPCERCTAGPGPLQRRCVTIPGLQRTSAGKRLRRCAAPGTRGLDFLSGDRDDD